MIVISDASPLIALAAVRQLELLRVLYSEILIPEAVYREVTATPGAPGAAAIGAAQWIHVEPASDRTLVAALAVELDEGEAEAIALAIQHRAELLLMDERRGRSIANRMGQRVTGVLGVLVEGKRHGHLKAIRPVMDALASEAGFHVSDALHARVLETAGE